MVSNLYKNLTKFELALWLFSTSMVISSFLMIPSGNYLTLIASLIGVAALIFVAKGYVIGQVLTVVSAIFYGIISFYFGYYGEMITYLGMTSPIAMLTVISWIKTPYKDTPEVAIHHMTKRQVFVMFGMTIVVTLIFYLILNALSTTNLLFSTISISTSFLASYLMFMRSPYYAIGYMANDLVLVILWILATIENITYFPMVICFIIFFINDSYGFFNWQAMKKRQAI